jgi:hypothetical protein
MRGNKPFSQRISFVMNTLLKNELIKLNGDVNKFMINFIHRRSILIKFFLKKHEVLNEIYFFNLH